MKKRNLVLASAVASALALAAGAAQAGTLSGTPTNYATQAVTAANNVVTVAAGSVVYTLTGTASVGTTVTMTLPSGMTFNVPPAVTCAGGTLACAASVTAGGAGQNYVTYTVTGAGAATDTITYGGFSVNGASALATAGASLKVTASSIGGDAGDTDPTTGTASTLGFAAMTSANGLTVTEVVNDLTVDISNYNGTKYSSGTAWGSSGSVNVAPTGGTVGANGVTAYAFPTGSAISAVVSGNFGSMTSFWLDTAACAATPGTGTSMTGTLTGNSATFNGLVSGTTYNVCHVSNGTSVIQVSNPVSVNATVSNSVGSKSASLGTITYGGTSAFVNYYVGNGAGYAMYLQVSNQSSAASKVIAVVNMADGTIKTGMLESAMPANTTKLYTVADINTATGASLNSETARGNLTILSNGSIKATNFMLNPGNTVTQMGQAF